MGKMCLCVSSWTSVGQVGEVIFMDHRVPGGWVCLGFVVWKGDPPARILFWAEIRHLLFMPLYARGSLKGSVSAYLNRNLNSTNQLNGGTQPNLTGILRPLLEVCEIGLVFGCINSRSHIATFHSTCCPPGVWGFNSYNPKQPVIGDYVCHSPKQLKDTRFGGS